MTTPYPSKDSPRELKGVLSAAKSLQKALSQSRKAQGGSTTKIDVQVADPDNSTGVSPCIFIIQGTTADEAFKHAEQLREQGCNCLSSGENEFTCHCDD